MDSKKSNKISDIVRLQRLLKKWKKFAKANASSTGNTSTGGGGSGGATKSINKFLKRTLSFTDLGSSNDTSVPKGFLAVDCVGTEVKRFIIPTDYLGHEAFGVLLREAEEEFGFQQEGVLKIPCEVPMFEKILKLVEYKGGSPSSPSSSSDVFLLNELGYGHLEAEMGANGCLLESPDCAHAHHPQTCR